MCAHVQVTAHPDDETIFFSPTINALRRANHEVFLLCFTNGAPQAATVWRQVSSVYGKFWNAGKQLNTCIQMHSVCRQSGSAVK